MKPPCARRFMRCSNRALGRLSGHSSPEHAISLGGNKRIVVDGALIDALNLPHGYWEAKDIHDDLDAEVQRKFAAGYPRDNILFQTPPKGDPVAE